MSNEKVARELVHQWEAGNPIDTADAANLAALIADALTAAEQRGAENQREALQSIIDPLLEMDWCIGYSLTRENMILLDKAQTAAAAIRRKD